MHAIRIDRTKRLVEEPHSGHNRYHPDIAPVLEVAEGEEVILETRDALDGQLGPNATVTDLAAADANLVHPLTGPVFIKGAKPRRHDRSRVCRYCTAAYGVQRDRPWIGISARRHDDTVCCELENS